MRCARCCCACRGSPKKCPEIVELDLNPVIALPAGQRLPHRRRAGQGPRPGYGGNAHRWLTSRASPAFRLDRLRPPDVPRRAARGGVRLHGGGHRVSGRGLPCPSAERRAGDRRRRRRRRRALGPNTGRSSPSAASRPSSFGPPKARSGPSAPSARTSIAPCSSRPTPRRSGARATTACTTSGGNVVSGPPPRNLEQFAVNLRGEAGDEDIVVSRG